MAAPNIPENRHLTDDTSPPQQKMKTTNSKTAANLQNRNQ
jgi:hypothetical protein